MDGKSLIDKAAAAVAGKAAIARKLGVSPQQVSAWYAGRKSIPPDVRAMLADMANRSAISELTTATLERARGKPFYDRLSAALTKIGSWRGGDVAWFRGTRK